MDKIQIITEFIRKFQNSNFFLRHKGDFSAVLSYPWYPVEFFGDHRSKTKFAKDFPNVICITNCKPRYSKSELKTCFEFWAKCHFQ